MMAAKKKKPIEKDTGTTLRDAAEKKLAGFPPVSQDLKGHSPEKLVHELQVHQIELEMQAEELKEAKLALEESRDRFLDLYDFAPVGYLTLDNKAIIEEVNLTGATLLGVERSKLVKTRFSKCILEKDIDEWHWYFVNMQNQEEKWCCTLTLKRGDGSVFPARLESIRIIDSTNGNTTVRVAVSDISDIRRAEEVQKNQYILLNSILESTDSAIFSVDSEYRYTNFNSAHARVMKVLYGADIEPGRSMLDYQSVREDRVLAQLNINRALAGEHVTEEAFSGEEGRSRRYFEVTHSPVKDADNNVIGVAVYAQDITDRKRAEDAMRESEERYRRITEGLTDYLYTVHVNEGKAVSTTHGAACVAVTGYTAEEFGADPYLWIRMVFEEDRDRVGRHFSGVLSGNPAPQIEHRIVRKDGQIRWVRDTPILQLNADGMLVSYDGVIKDITATKQVEEALQKNTDELRTAIDKLTSSEEELRQSIDDLGRSEQALQESEGRVRLKLESLLAPEGDIGSLELGDIIDTQILQPLMDDFTRLTGMATAIIDIKGNVLVATGWQEICTRFHRVNTVTAGFCTDSDLHLAKNLKQGEYVAYKCRNNLWDVVTPLYVGSRHLGNIYTGQFFYTDDIALESVFIEQAEKYGFDRESYLAAFHRVPRIHREKVHELMDYLVKFTGFISRLSYSNLKLARTVTERDTLLTSLQKSEDKFRTLVEFAPVGFYLTDPDGKCLLVNKEWSRVSGLTPEEAKGSGWVTGLHPDDRDTVMASWDRMISSRGAWGLEYRFLPKGREPVFVYGIATALLDENGIITGYIGANIDISDRKRKDAELLKKHEELMASFEQLTAAEEELKGQFDELSVSQEALIKSEERFRLTLDATNDGIWDWNVLKVTTFFSPHWYTMLGYEPDEMPASHATWRSLIHPDDLSRIEQKMKDHIRTHVGYAVEVRMRTKQGNWCWILSRGRVVEQDKDGFPVRVIGTHTDITERKGAEEQLNKTVDELKRFNNLTVDRELRMIALKQEINALLKNAGEQEKYRIDT